MKANIALFPGDGIGPEVVSAAADVLQAVAERFGSLLRPARFLFKAEREPGKFQFRDALQIPKIIQCGLSGARAL